MSFNISSVSHMPAVISADSIRLQLGLFLQDLLQVHTRLSQWEPWALTSLFWAATGDYGYSHDPFRVASNIPVYVFPLCLLAAILHKEKPPLINCFVCLRSGLYKKGRGNPRLFPFVSLQRESFGSLITRWTLGLDTLDMYIPDHRS